MTDTRTCPDCAVPPGAQHEDGCDVARCLADGSQRLGCGWNASGPRVTVTDLGDGVIGVRPHDCGQDVWTGEWPGVAECREFGWYAQFRGAEGLGFVLCTPDAPGAREDLNRLAYDARWSPEQARWVLR